MRCWVSWLLDDKVFSSLSEGSTFHVHPPQFLSLCSTVTGRMNVLEDVDTMRLASRFALGGAAWTLGNTTAAATPMVSVLASAAWQTQFGPEIRNLWLRDLTQTVSNAKQIKARQLIGAAGLLVSFEYFTDVYSNSPLLRIPDAIGKYPGVIAGCAGFSAVLLPYFLWYPFQNANVLVTESIKERKTLSPPQIARIKGFTYDNVPECLWKHAGRGPSGLRSLVLHRRPLCLR